MVFDGDEATASALESFSGRLRVASVFVCMLVCVYASALVFPYQNRHTPSAWNMEQTPTDDGRQSV